VQRDVTHFRGTPERVHNFHFLSTIVQCNTTDLSIVWAVRRAAEQAHAAKVLAASIETPLATDIAAVVATPSIIPLVVFSGSVLGILASFGGGVAMRPAVIGDLFGTKYVGVITAQQLGVLVPSAFIGPRVANYFRDVNIRAGIDDLSMRVDPAVFERAFGTGRDNLQLLVDSNSIS
jgi:hypothetical protein